MSSFFIKMIAIITMFLDHSADTFSFVPNIWVLNVVGRIAFPLFAFQLFVGYSHTKDVKKYFIRLITFALISQIPFSLLMFIMTGSAMAYGNFIALNIFFTLALGLLAMYVYDCKLNVFAKIVIIALLLVIAQICNVDYGAWGVCLILFIRLFYPKKVANFSPVLNLCDWQKNLPSKLVAFINYSIFILGFFGLCFLRYSAYLGHNLFLIRILPQLIFTFLPAIIMLFYNGKKGPSMKYFFYAFYPLHLIILELAFLCIFVLSFNV